MQDRYAFDVGDFGKFGLLRHLMGWPESNNARFQLGVLWYFADVPSLGNDGRHIAYLEHDRDTPTSVAARSYRVCDPTLYDTFRRLLRNGAARRILNLEQSGILPQTTIFVGDRVLNGMGRSDWFERCAQKIAGRTLVFCDPDNGIAWPGQIDYVRGSEKHILPGEVEKLYNQGASLVIYHHLNRKTSHEAQIQDQIARLQRLLPRARRIWGARLRRGSSRVFLVIPQSHDEAVLHERMQSFNSGPWTGQGHFSVQGV